MNIFLYLRSTDIVCHKCNQVVDCLSTCYTTKDLDNTIVPTWPWYSMIHTLFDKTEFILYTKSHLVKKKECPEVFDCTRIRIRFPEQRSFMIIFNGLLLHCGAAAIEKDSNEKDGSTTFSNSFRLFGYINRDGQKRTRSKNERNYPQSNRGIINTTYKLIKCHKSGNGCSKSGKEKLVDVNAIFGDCMYNCTQEVKAIGNLEVDGWTVIEGLNNVTKEFIVHEINAINSKKNSPWGNIEKIPKNKAYRDQYKLTEDQKHEYQGLYKYFGEIENHIRENIHGFKNATIDSKHIIRNVNGILEQTPHMDYFWNKE